MIWKKTRHDMEDHIERIKIEKKDDWFILHMIYLKRNSLLLYSHVESEVH